MRKKEKIEKMFKSSGDAKRRSKNRRAQDQNGRFKPDSMRHAHCVLGLGCAMHSPIVKSFISIRQNQIQPRGASRALDPLTGSARVVAQAPG
jgi:hypothetical protein